MNILEKPIIAVVAVLSLLVLTFPSSAKQAISVEDLVRFATIGDPLSLDWNESVGEAGIFSPDGMRVAVVVRRGNIERGTNDGTLLVYRTADLLREVSPKTVAEFASATNYQPIAYVRWLSDSETLVFSASHDDQVPQVYRANVRTGKLDQLTHESSRILWSDVSLDGRWLATLTFSSKKSMAEDEICKRRGCRITADTLGGAEWQVKNESAPLTVYDLNEGKAKALTSPEAADESIKRCDSDLKGGISPDGRFALRMCELGEWPAAWDYTAGRIMRSCKEQKNTACARRLMLIDLQSGDSVPLSDAPSVYNQPAPHWIVGGRYFILSGALESLTDVEAQERARRSAAFAVLLVDPLTLKSRRIDRLDPKVAEIYESEWDDVTEILTVRTQDAKRAALPAVSYRREGEHWVKLVVPHTEKAKKVRTPVELRVEQSLNDPPVLAAIDLKTGVKRRVLDPNPWLANRQLGLVKAITWQVREGLIWRAGLYYPPDYSPEKRYPVVLQTHGFDSERFSVSGYSRNFAGRALAAQDIIVLQVEERFGEASTNPEELTIVQIGYEAAVAHLDSLGIIDRTRVGIQGWSRSGPWTGYTLTHSSYPFAAGAFTSTADFGWLWYLSAGAPEELDALYGAAPFGDGLKEWFNLSPSFNLDRVHTPMMMLGNGSSTVLWDWYAGLRRLRKPVEYWVLPDGTHDVFQVTQRMHNNQLLVDWFRFWLKGEEDHVPAKAEQYSRWRQFRRLQNPDLAALNMAKGAR
jgi:hypothetical protein